MNIQITIKSVSFLIALAGFDIYASTSDQNKLSLNHVFETLPNHQQKIEGVLEIVNGKVGININKTQKVNMLCGRSIYYIKSLNMKVMEDGINLIPHKNGGSFNFRVSSELANCIGIGTRLMFSKEEWIPFFDGEYKNGGFILENGKFKFLKGTKGRTQIDSYSIFNGKNWVAPRE